jgi:hypothetical protein
MANVHKSLTFKQFLEEHDEPLARLAVEMWFRLNIDPNKDHARTYAGWFEGEMDDLPQHLHDQLMAHYNDEIPYRVAKGDDEVAPDQWFFQTIRRQMKAEGVLD